MIHDEWCRSIPADYILYPSLPPFSARSLSLYCHHSFFCMCAYATDAKDRPWWWPHDMGTAAWAQLSFLFYKGQRAQYRGVGTQGPVHCACNHLLVSFSLSLSLFLSLFSASSPPGSIDHGNILFFYAYIHVILIWVILIIGCTVRSADKRCGLIFF